MDLIRAYLEAVPLPLLILLPAGVLAALIFTPARYRLGGALALMVVWMVIGRYPGLGTPQALAKATGLGAFVLLMVATVMHPGPRRAVPPIGWAVILLALYSCVFIVTVSDLVLTGVLRLQWVALVVSAVMVSTRVLDEEGIRYVVRWLALGLAISVCVAAMALVLNPADAFRKGLGRFEPWGANSNQIGVVFSLTAVLGIYLGVREPMKTARVFWFCVCGTAAGLGLLTASRSTLATMALPCIPAAWAMRRNPVFASAIGVVVLVGAGLFLRQFVETTNLDRLTTLKTGRVDIAGEYIELVSERPLLGMLESQGIRMREYEEVGAHPHNAYLEMLYLGGLAFALPMLILYATAARNAVVLWVRRRRLWIDPMLITTLVVLHLMMFLHGFVNGAITYPTYAWSWVFVFTIGLFGGLVRESAQARENEHDSDASEAYEYGEDGYGAAVA